MSSKTPSKQELITPRILSGFRDFTPEVMIPRERMVETARQVYRSFGFAPIDTPCIEYLEILLGKGGEESDKQLYRFEDNGGRQVGLRFDLTVPLARFVAQYAQDLGTPFKRYHIGTVWRGEKKSFGRYREFMQCDFDTIGVRHVGADIEAALVIHDLLRALGFERFSIRLNNRQVLNGLLQGAGLAEQSAAVLRALDKLAKIGPELVQQEMCQVAGASPQQAAEILKLAELSGTNEQILTALEPLVAGNETGEAGVARLRDIVAGFAAAGADVDRLKLDVSIARGLDYYTGVVFETLLDDLTDIGSVCSGGRYDNLAGLYTKQELPGVGASLGLDRLLTAQEKLGLITATRTAAPVFIAFFDKQAFGKYLQIASWIRAAGIGVEVYPEPKKLGQQLQYADRRRFRLALIMGSQELESGVCQVKDLWKATQEEAPLGPQGESLVAKLRQILEEPSE